APPGIPEFPRIAHHLMAVPRLSSAVRAGLRRSVVILGSWACLTPTRNSAAAGWVCSASAVTTTPARSRRASSGANAGTSSGRADLALGQHRAALVVHRRQQVHRAAVTVRRVGAAQRLAVDGHRPPANCGSATVAIQVAV